MLENTKYVKEFEDYRCFQIQLWSKKQLKWINKYYDFSNYGDVLNKYNEMKNHMHKAYDSIRIIANKSDNNISDFVLHSDLNIN